MGNIPSISLQFLKNKMKNNCCKSSCCNENSNTYYYCNSCRSKINVNNNIESLNGQVKDCERYR